MPTYVAHTKFKNSVQAFAGILIFIALIVLSLLGIVLFVRGGSYAVDKVLPLLVSISSFVLFVTIFVFLPLSIVKKLRGLLAFVFLFSSLIFGLTAWLIGFALTLYLLGVGWLILGFFLAGVGVVPIGMIASLIHGETGIFWNLLVASGLTMATRIYAFWLAEKYDQFTRGSFVQNDHVERVELESSDHYDKLVATLNQIKHGNASDKLKKQITKKFIEKSSLTTSEKQQLLDEAEKVYNENQE